MIDEKKPRTRRTWTPEDDAALTIAVKAVLPLAFRTRDLWWAAVCGRMGLPDVTPDSARSRWERLQEAEAQARVAREEAEARQAIQQQLEAQDDTWQQLADEIEVRERELDEATYDEVQQIRAEIALVREQLVKQQAILERLLGMWQ
jgi:septal ring factor EnvC (AmiA/AmiB activator)